jgi:hypothetical protein
MEVQKIYYLSEIVAESLLKSDVITLQNKYLDQEKKDTLWIGEEAVNSRTEDRYRPGDLARDSRGEGSFVSVLPMYFAIKNNEIAG